MRAILSNADETWDAALRELPGGHVLQSSAWGAFKASTGWRCERVVVEREERIVAGAQVLLRRLPVGSVAYIPKGPVVDPQCPEALDVLLPAVHDRARRAAAVFLKIEPPGEDTPDARAVWTSRGFAQSTTVQPRATIAVDISPDPDTVLGRMKQKWRYNIRLAARKGVKVRSALASDLPTFYRLMQVTSARDGFAIHTEAYYAEAWRRLVGAGVADLFLAEYDAELLGGVFVTAFGPMAIYMYGASSDSHRNLMPNHLLQWEAMRWAKARGCVEYDFWGIPDEAVDVGGQAAIPDAAAQDSTGDSSESERSGGLWGVYRFKQGFGGRTVRWPGAFDYSYRPGLYWLGTRLMPRLRGRVAL